LDFYAFYFETYKNSVSFSVLFGFICYIFVKLLILYNLI